MLIELDVFSQDLTSAVYLYASAAFFLTLAAATLWLTRPPRRESLQWAHRAA
jgi:hypothetical protein